MLADGRLHLSGVGKLAPHLTRENAPALLAPAAHRTKRQIEELVAELAPRPDAPTLVRKLPARPPSVAPRPSLLTPERQPLPPEGAAAKSTTAGRPWLGIAARQGLSIPGQPRRAEAAAKRAGCRSDRHRLATADGHGPLTADGRG